MGRSYDDGLFKSQFKSSEGDADWQDDLYRCKSERAGVGLIGPGDDAKLDTQEAQVCACVCAYACVEAAFPHMWFPVSRTGGNVSRPMLSFSTSRKRT